MCRVNKRTTGLVAKASEFKKPHNFTNCKTEIVGNEERVSCISLLALSSFLDGRKHAEACPENKTLNSKYHTQPSGRLKENHQYFGFWDAYVHDDSLTLHRK